MQEAARSKMQAATAGATMRRERSRSRSRQGYRGGGGRRGGAGGGGGAPDRGGSRRNEPSAEQARPGADQDRRGGQSKAKEAMEREREKARLKKLGREKEQHDKAQSRQSKKEQKIEDTRQQLDLALARPTGSSAIADTASNGDTKVSAARAKILEFQKMNAAASVELATGSQPSGGRRKGSPKTVENNLDEPLMRRLFALLDRSGKGSVSQRDVLVALKKHPQVRRLFCLPTNNVEEGGEALEKRLLAIQDAFEAGSGLGEVGPVFSELRDASGASGQSFGWDAFVASCRKGGFRETAAAAAALLPREHATGEAFVPTARWTEVPSGAACPAGLEYKMDMETGTTLARLTPKP